MESTIDRIYKITEYKKDSIYRLSKNIGVSNGYFSKQRQSDGAVSSNIIEKIVIYYPDIDANWLLTGRGEMLKQNASGNEAESEGAILTQSTNLEDATPFYASLPVSAGESGLAGIVSDETPDGYMRIPGVHAKALFPVIGCSMQPIIKPGDIIGINEVNRWDLVDPGKIYMIITNEERMIKRLRVDDDNDDILWCVSENYKDFKISKESIKAIYHVVFHGELL